MSWRRAFLAAILGFSGGLSWAPGADAQSAQPSFGVRGLPASPPRGARPYVPGQIILKAREGASEQDIVNRVINQNRESFRAAAVERQPLRNGAVLLDVSGALRTPESTRGQSRFALERTTRPEAAAPGSLDSLIARLAQDPDVVYVKKNYLLQRYGSHEAINQMLGSPSARDAREPGPEVEPPPPSAGSEPAAPGASTTAAIPDDPFFRYQWHLRANGADFTELTAPGGAGFASAWPLHYGIRHIVVAVLDTGLLLDHEDFHGSANLLPGIDLISDPWMANDGDGRDADPQDPGDAVQAGECWPGSPPERSSWHGTHVAGIVGGLSTNNGIGIAGAAWNVTVVPVRVLGRCGGVDADIIDGIAWAAGLSVEGLPVRRPVDIINMSLGGPYECSPDYQEAIDRAVERGVTVVVAAGNDADDAERYTPAGCRNVISVAAGDARGHLTAYSNFGASVDILAPGGDVGRDDDGDGQPDGVLSAVQGTYEFNNGTSMAAPMVSAAVALLKSVEPHLSPAEIEQRLKQTAIPRSAAQCPQPCGAGLLDVLNLLNCSAGAGAQSVCRLAEPAAAVAGARRTMEQQPAILPARQ